MNIVRNVRQYNDLFHRIAVEFLTERLGIEPTMQEISKFIEYLRELNSQHKKTN